MTHRSRSSRDLDAILDLWMHLVSPKVLQNSPKVRKSEIKGPAVRTKMFCSPKVQYTDIRKYMNALKLVHNPSKLFERVGPISYQGYATNND